MKTIRLINNLLLLFLSIFIWSCEEVERKARIKMLEGKSSYSVNFLGETWEKAYKVEYDSLGKKLAEGNYAIRKDGKIGYMRIGEWKEYYSDSGRLMSIGKYKIGTYYFCGTTPNVNCYNYKTGFWKYFFKNGYLKAEGDYKMTEINIENSCESGTLIKLGVIDDNWTLNKIIKDSIQSWNTLKEFQLVYQGARNLYSGIGVNGKGETVIEQK